MFCSQVAEDISFQPAAEDMPPKPAPRVPRQATFHCPVYGPIDLAKEYVQFTDTEPVQRLRGLAQLGLASWVFPAANHTRFEHSLGVCHLAHQFAARVYETQKAELDMTTRDVTCVGLAGLCHDLGHGPFSHAWERFLAAKGMNTWKHEDMSCQLVEYIQDMMHFDCIEPEDVRLIKALISGKRESAAHEKGFLFDIVANETNGVDVDKMDYLLRDPYHTGVNKGVCVDWNTLMRCSKVIDDRICYQESTYQILKHMFDFRAHMYSEVYCSRKVRAIDIMVIDALMHADASLNLSQHFNSITAQSCQEFMMLDDSILRQIECRKQGDADICAAQAILKRLRCRDLYVCVGEVMVPHEMITKNNWQQPTSQDVCSYWHANGEVQLYPEQVVVDVAKISWGLKESNPLEHVRWYQHQYSTECTPLDPHKMTGLIPRQFQDHRLRVYSKVTCEKVNQALLAAFEGYCHKVFGSQVVIRATYKADAPPCPSANGHSDVRGLSTPKLDRQAYSAHPPGLKRKHKALDDDEEEEEEEEGGSP